MSRIAVLAALCLAASSTAASAAGAAAPTTRKVFVTIADKQGARIPDITAADLVVKEGGKEREVAGVELPAKMRLALLVEERLVGDGSVRMALFEFMKRALETADISLISVGMRNTTVADYTSDLNMLVGAINKFSLNPAPQSNLSEGILEVASRFAEEKPERAGIVVVALSGGQAGVDPRNVLDKIRQSGATMAAATLAGGGEAAGVGAMGDASGREQVLGDGTRQTGGRRIEVAATGGFTRALQQIADDLIAQYAITYTLPDGVKPDKRFSISSKKRGVTLRAPSAIPDR